MLAVKLRFKKRARAISVMGAGMSGISQNRALQSKYVISAIGLTFVLAAPALAQERPAGFEPMNVVADINGVDLLSGKMTFPVPPLSVAVAPELSITRIQDIVNYISGTRFIDANGDPQINADLRVGAGTSERFECPNALCVSKSGRHGALAGGPGLTIGAPGLFTYTEGGSGRQFRYDQTASQSITGGTQPGQGSNVFTYWASQVTSPDGVVLDFEYDIFTFSANTRNLRPIKVKSNRGFQLRITYASNDPYNVAWAVPSVAAIYREGEFGAPIASVAYPAGSASDMAGAVWTGNFQNSLGVNGSVANGGYRPPTNAADQIVATSTVSDERGPLLTSIVKGATQSWSYAYSHATTNSGTNNPYVANRTVTITGPASYFRKVWITEGRKLNARITQEQDALNRTTFYTTDSFGRITRVQMPEGNAVELTYDLMGNITKKTAKAKIGSGLVDIIEEATFPTDPLCPDNAYTYCYRPLTVKDGKGNITDYEWTSFGALAKVTSPTQSNGNRPQKRIEYVQRFAWYNNGSGTFVRSPTGIWLKSRERFCKTSAASGNSCAGGATDEVVTDYDYGPDSGPNYLLLRGIAVTATNSSGVLETLRTCFTYDARGNKISETQPLGTGSTCP